MALTKRVESNNGGTTRKFILGTDRTETGHTYKDTVVEVIVYKDRFDNLSGSGQGDITAIVDVTTLMALSDT